MRTISLVVCAVASLIAEESVSVSSVPMRARLTYEDWLLNGNEHMGMVGTHEDIFIGESLPGVYAGLGFFSAAAGDRGGFFVFGPTLGWTSPSYAGFSLDTGTFFGAGGYDTTTAVGGGMGWRAHAMASYAVPGGSLQAGYAFTDFPDGDIRGNGLSVGVTIDEELSLVGLSPAVHHGGVLERRRWSFGVFSENYWLDDGIDGHNGSEPGSQLNVLGFEYTKRLDGGWSVPVMLGAAVGEGQFGYMEVLSGLAYGIGNRWYTEARMMAGFGGGAWVDTGGGIMIRPEIGVGLRLGSDYKIEARGGRLWGSDNFTGWLGTMALLWEPEWWNVQSDGGQMTTSLPASSVGLDYWRIVIGSTAFRFSGHDEVADTELLDVAFERPLKPWLAILGRTRWAYKGEDGGYAEAAFGSRLEWQAVSQIRLALEGDLGVGGGIPQSTGNGTFAAFGGDVRWQFWRPLELSLGYSRVKGFDGQYTTDAISLGLVIGITRALVRD